MKVFLTGASGILGSDIAAIFRDGGHKIDGFNSTTIRLADYQDVEAKMLASRPEMVIHCAAMTNVDLCEDDRGAAIAINVTGTENIARAASLIGARLIYISSCGVYGNGKSTAYVETDALNPQTYHHYTKLLGEEKIRQYLPEHLIIRPGWLFGGTTAQKKNFVEARRKEASGAESLSSAADKVGSPTYTEDLARQILLLVEHGVTGTFNAVNEGCASRYEYVAEIVRLFGLSAIVQPVNSNAFPRKANMPDNECLENRHLEQMQLNRMRPWKEALADYIHKVYHLS